MGHSLMSGSGLRLVSMESDFEQYMLSRIILRKRYTLPDLRELVCVCVCVRGACAGYLKTEKIEGKTL